MFNSQQVDTSPGVSVRAQPDTSKWLTRNEASDMLACSPQTILNHERRGYLHPLFSYRADVQGRNHRVHVYSPEELKRLATRLRRVVPREAGEVAARSFEMFAEGKKLQDVVVALRASPETIEQLHEKWLDMGGSDLVISPAAKEAFEAIFGPFESVTELLERVSKKP